MIPGLVDNILTSMKLSVWAEFIGFTDGLLN